MPCSNTGAAGSGAACPRRRAWGESTAQVVPSRSAWRHASSLPAAIWASAAPVRRLFFSCRWLRLRGWDGDGVTGMRKRMRRREKRRRRRRDDCTVAYARAGERARTRARAESASCERTNHRLRRHSVDDFIARCCAQLPKRGVEAPGPCPPARFDRHDERLRLLCSTESACA